MPDTAILLCPYNHSQQLEVGADGTSTYPKDPIQEEENDYKKGSKEKQGRGDPNTPEAPEKAPRILPRTNFYLLNSAHGEYLDGCHSHTKAQLSGPLSTNLLYWAHWSKVSCILDLAWKNVTIQ